MQWHEIEMMRQEIECRHGVSEVLRVYRYLEAIRVTLKELEAMQSRGMTSPLLLDVVGLMVKERRLWKE